MYQKNIQFNQGYPLKNLAQSHLSSTIQSQQNKSRNVYAVQPQLYLSHPIQQLPSNYRNPQKPLVKELTKNSQIMSICKPQPTVRYIKEQSGANNTQESFKATFLKVNVQKRDLNSNNNSVNNSINQSIERIKDYTFVTKINQTFPVKKLINFQSAQIQDDILFRKQSCHDQNDTKKVDEYVRPSQYQQKQLGTLVKSVNNDQLIHQSLNNSYSQLLQDKILVQEGIFTQERVLAYDRRLVQDRKFVQEKNQSKQFSKVNQQQFSCQSSNIVSITPPTSNMIEENTYQEDTADIEQVQGQGMAQEELDDLMQDHHRRRKSIILFEMHIDTVQNQMLEQLRQRTLDNDNEDEDLDEAKLISMKSILERLSILPSETLVFFKLQQKAKAKRLKVSVNGKYEKREFYIDIGQIPQQWNLRQLAQILNKMYSESLGGDKSELKLPMISVLVQKEKRTNRRLDQSMKIFELIDLAASGIMGSENQINLEESTS